MLPQEAPEMPVMTGLQVAHYSEPLTGRMALAMGADPLEGMQWGGEAEKQVQVTKVKPCKLQHIQW